MKKLLLERKKILIGGHRGCKCAHPENTIAAMKEGISRGADYLEIDVQLTRDEIPVIFHDTRLEKKTRLSGYVHEYSLSELRSVFHLETLADTLDWGKQNNVYFALELKAVPRDTQKVNFKLAELLPSVVKKTDMRENVYAFGADYQVLKKIKQTAPDFYTGLIVPFVPQDPLALVKETQALVYLSYIYNIPENSIAQLQKAGCFVSGAILSDDFWVERAVKAGVDMFESDFPEKYAHL